MTKKELGLKNGTKLKETRECFSQNKKMGWTVQIMVNPARLILYPNINFLKALRM